MEALRAVRALRTDRGGGLDRLYLGNLGVAVARSSASANSILTSCQCTVGDLIQDLRWGGATPKAVVFAGRNLYVALRDEAVIDIRAESELDPFPGHAVPARCSRTLDPTTIAFTHASDRSEGNPGT